LNADSERRASTALSDRVALVTGGSRGIGEAIVRRFAAAGASVVLCSRSKAEGFALAEELTGLGRTVEFAPCDVANEADVQALIEMIVERYGRLDVLVNNAGITASGTVEETTLDTWRAVLDANMTTMFLVTKYAIPALRRSRTGSIINLGSSYGVVGAAGSAAYAVTKAAAINLAKTLALELAVDGIRANALCPGATATPMNAEWLTAQPDAEQARRDLVAKHPIGRMSSPDEQAGAALFLASDDSSFVTGHALMADGGYTAI
jgi:NAD(P)-dependent dehydrogenase (short-subunit alcohol dehydrogenase family)